MRLDDVANSPTKPKKRVPCEVYSRVVGYLRPVDAWNKGKQQEFKERKVYSVSKPKDASDE